MGPAPARTRGTGLTDAVVAAAQAGDTDALGSVWTLLSPGVHGYLRTQGAEDPEGLTSEVFVQVIGRLGGMDGGASGLRTFVFSVAHARLVDERRRQARRQPETSYDPERDPRRAVSAEALAIEDEGERRALAALHYLNEEQAMVITLRVLGDLTVEQAARALGKSPGAVKQLQRRGLLALRRRVESGEVAL